MAEFLTAAFYKFVDLPDCADLRQVLLDICLAQEVKGLIILAPEGINGTIAGQPENVLTVLDFLKRDPRLADLSHKQSLAPRQPFYRMKVRLKREIVTLGVHDIHPPSMAGVYVKPQDWNTLLSDPDVVVIDTRNDYEVELGTFKGAINPNIRSFSELPDWLEKEPALQKAALKNTKVAMFCTGGIRCEKSTALLRARGFSEVYHLEGGILKYLETVPEDQSLWQGDCFVFDERVSVSHGLIAGTHGLCRACRQPLEDGASQSPLYEAGVSCPRCHAITSDQQKSSARERQRQWQLAKSRQQNHIGQGPVQAAKN